MSTILFFLLNDFKYNYKRTLHIFLLIVYITAVLLFIFYSCAVGMEHPLLSLYMYNKGLFYSIRLRTVTLQHEIQSIQEFQNFNTLLKFC